MINILNRLFRKIIKKYKVSRKIKKLYSLKKTPKKGSADWLCLKELEFGGYISNIKRNKVSSHDPRSNRELANNGMIGGDRMIHHNYANIYEKYLSRHVKKKSKLNIIEIGILNGTGLAVWSKLFQKSTLVGLDIDLTHFKNNFSTLKKNGAFKDTNLIIHEFDQFKPNESKLKNILGQKKFHIIIDDGFHSDETILNTFSYLKQFFANDFIYFVEDNSTVYLKLKKKFPNNKIISYGEFTVIKGR